MACSPASSSSGNEGRRRGDDRVAEAPGDVEAGAVAAALRQ